MNDPKSLEIDGSSIRIAIENAFLQGSVRNNKVRAKLVTRAIWSSDFMNRMVRDNLRSLARDEVKKIFSARNILEKWMHHQDP